MSETLESGSACGAQNFLHPTWLLTAIPRSCMSGFVNSQDIHKFCALNIFKHLKIHLYPLHPLVRQRFWACDVAPGHGGSRGRCSFGRRRSGMDLEVHRLLNLMRFVELHPRALINLQTWSLDISRSCSGFGMWSPFGHIWICNRRRSWGWLPFCRVPAQGFRWFRLKTVSLAGMWSGDPQFW